MKPSIYELAVVVFSKAGYMVGVGFKILTPTSLPLIHSRRVVVSYKRKYVHKLLVNRLLKPAQEKVWLSELTVPQ